MEEAVRATDVWGAWSIIVGDDKTASAGAAVVLKL
jgi:hypothetical protein